jgi:hypothetical protein
MSVNRISSVEITGTIRGLDGQAFLALKRCQAFINQTAGHEVVVVTDVLALQSLLETAFSTRSEVTVVYEPNANAQNELRQIRFNAPGSVRRSFSEGVRCDSSFFALALSIDDLNLVDYAKAAAEKLLSDFPDVVFTSGRRDVAQQASAMAGNVVQNRDWIKETYLASAERDSLQGWVDANPDAATKAAIAAGLASVMAPWTDEQKRRLSRHFSGQAFDVQPMTGSQGDAVKAAINALPNLRQFLDNEGGLVIWHADFELAGLNISIT